MAISLLSLFAPVTRAVTVRSTKADCCAKMKIGDAQHDCGKQAPKSKQERQCCAACAIGLTLLLSPGKPFFYPPSAGNPFATYSALDYSRSDRPPVPPPRTLSA
jgi:hypothetical protein